MSPPDRRPAPPERGWLDPAAQTGVGQRHRIVAPWPNTRMRPHTEAPCDTLMCTSSNPSVETGDLMRSLAVVPLTARVSP
jgi:hypothetical protein